MNTPRGLANHEKKYENGHTKYVGTLVPRDVMIDEHMGSFRHSRFTKGHNVHLGKMVHEGV
jgi:hypothetical protein